MWGVGGRGVGGWRDALGLCERGFFLLAILCLCWPTLSSALHTASATLALPVFLSILDALQMNPRPGLMARLKKNKKKKQKSLRTTHSLSLAPSTKRPLDSKINQLPPLVMVIGSYSFWVLSVVLRGTKAAALIDFLCCCWHLVGARYYVMVHSLKKRWTQRGFLSTGSGVSLCLWQGKKKRIPKIILTLWHKKQDDFSTKKIFIIRRMYFLLVFVDRRCGRHFLFVPGAAFDLSTS